MQDKIPFMSDLNTIMWKETRSWLRYQGSKTRTIMTLVSPLFIAVYLPWQSGPDWSQKYLSLIMAFIVPTMIAGLTVPDSFAGEKERNTLPTLLTSRLPDRAILFGKMLFGIIMAWTAGLLLLVIGLIAANLSHGEGFLFYSPSVLGAYLGFSLLMATLTTGAGVLISMRAKSAQEASQLLISSLLMPPTLLGVMAMMYLTRSDTTLASVDFRLILLIAAAVLLVATVVVVLAAMRRFQRSRLVFD
jgi:ABC-2 type transport system permease protein